MLNKIDMEKLLNESPEEGGLNKADIKFAVRAYLKAGRGGEITEAIIEDFLKFVEEL
jgi:hypothetical protein